MRKQTVFIVGAGGMVGATTAHALAITETVDDIALIDIAEDLVRGQALDINHATAYTKGVRVRVGAYDEIKEDDIVVITSGIAQKPGQDRLSLLGDNVRVIKEVVHAVMRQGKPVYIVMVSNPVDILTHVALRESGLPKERVLGTGTVLDTARLKVALADMLQVSQQDVLAYIFGEHGDSSFPALSAAVVGGIPIATFPGFKQDQAMMLTDTIREAAQEIIAAKRSTYYGISRVVVHVVGALLRDAGSVMPVCSLATGEYGINDVVLGLPSLVSTRGVRILDHYPLNDDEMRQLKHAAEVVRHVTVGLDSF